MPLPCIHQEGGRRSNSVILILYLLTVFSFKMLTSVKNFKGNIFLFKVFKAKSGT